MKSLLRFHEKLAKGLQEVTEEKIQSRYFVFPNQQVQLNQVYRSLEKIFPLPLKKPSDQDMVKQ
jgi:hypothetical protein